MMSIEVPPIDSHSSGDPGLAKYDNLMAAYAQAARRRRDSAAYLVSIANLTVADDSGKRKAMVSKPGRTWRREGIAGGLARKKGDGEGVLGGGPKSLVEIGAGERERVKERR